MRSAAKILSCFFTSAVVLGGSFVTSFAAGDSTKPGIPYPPDASHPGPAWFIDVAPQVGLRMQNVNGGVNTKKYIIETTGSGVAVFDYDNDGWPDIFLVNG